MAEKSISESLLKNILFVAVVIIVFDVVSSLLSGGHILTACFVIYLAISIKSVSGKVRALRIRMGTVEYDKVFTNGYFWFFWGIDKIWTVPTKQQEIDIPKQVDIITLEKTIEDKEYGSLNVDVDEVVYFTLPEDFEGLLKAYRNGPDFMDPEKIKIHYLSFLIAKVRDACGNSAYIEIQKNAQAFVDQFKNSVLGDPENPFNKTGITNFWLGTQGMKLPASFTAALSSEQTSRLNKKGTIIDAQAENEKRNWEGKGAAAALEYQLDVMDKHQRMARVDSFQKAAQGPGNFIVDVQSFLQASRFDDEEMRNLSTILKELPVELVSKFNLLTPESQAEVAKNLLMKFRQEIESLNKK